MNNHPRIIPQKQLYLIHVDAANFQVELTSALLLGDLSRHLSGGLNRDAPAILARHPATLLFGHLLGHLPDHWPALRHGDWLANLSRNLSDNLGADQLGNVGADFSGNLLGHLARNLVALGLLDILAALKI